MTAENESHQAAGAALMTDTTTDECNEISTRAQKAGSDEAVAELTKFYTTIWPKSGIYALFTLPDKKHYQCVTVADAVAKTFKLDASPVVQAVYHACASFKEPKVTDDKGKERFRVQKNVRACRSLCIDVDCGEEKAATGLGYVSKNTAHKEVMQFLRKHSIPAPTYIIDSGHGTHCYWSFTEEVDSDSWGFAARALDALFKADGLLVDPARTTDSASVLRPPGTTNRKEQGAHRTVTIKHHGELVSFEKLNAAISAAAEKHGVALYSSTIRNDLPDWIKGTTGNLDGQVAEYQASDAERVAEQCQQIMDFRRTGGESEPLWWMSIGVVKHCVNGENKAHEWSAVHADYDYAETQEKLDGWNAGPTTCEKFKSINAKRCEGCTHTCKSPISLGAEILADAVPRWLSEMNEQYAWIEKDAGIYRLLYRDFISMDRFHAAHANQTLEVKVGKTTKDISYSRMFMCSKQRGQFNAIVTRPGEPPVTLDGCLNDWAGFTCESKLGSVAPWLGLFAWLFGQERFPLLWLAHLIQQPGIKMFVGLVVWSQSEGVGKNLLFETVGALFSSHHYALISQSEVDDDFSGWIPGTVFAVADEVRASKSDKSRDRLKLWQTSPSLRTHDKGQPKRIVENLMNLVFLSNHADGMFLGDHDRRYYVHEVMNGPLPESLKCEFLEWRENGGLSHLLHYLMNLDLGGFDPKGRAPVTASKAAMIEAGRSDLDRWAMDVVSGSIPIGKEVATAEELTGKFLFEYPQVRNAPPVATCQRRLKTDTDFLRAAI